MCLFVHTLYVKFVEPIDIVIVCLYVDDLMCNGNNLKLVVEFKQALVNCFEMTNIGLMSYFPKIEVVQQRAKIFISQNKYTNDILKKFQMQD